MKEKVLIIGGGSNLPTFNADDYDIVVRINLGICEGDCDVWVWGGSSRIFKRDFLYKSIEALIGDSQYKKLLRVDGRPITEETCPLNALDKASTISKELYWDLAASYKNESKKTKPTSGLMAILYYLHLGEDVTIIGFDGYSTPNRFIKEENHNPRSHDLNVERAAFDSLHSDGLIKRL